MEFKGYRRKAYYYETDRMDIVHHSNYVRWLEEARVDMLEQAGYPFGEMEKRGVVSPVLSVQTEYKFPVRFDEEFEVKCRLTKFNGCKYELDYVITNITTGKIACIAHTAHCFTDSSLRPLRLKNTHPDIYASFMEAVEK
jgi:acyl-CoA thioester hydrolase